MNTTNYTPLIHTTLTYIEANLESSLSLSTVAERAKCSPYHFHRVFSASTGWPLASYVRARRLTCAARQVLDTPYTIMRVAVAHGFDSQAAFARAFKKHFGITPTQLRKRGSLRGLLLCQPLDLTHLEHLAKETITVEPTITHQEAFQVIGMSTTFVPNEAHDIPDLWARFMQQAHTVPGRVLHNRSYGVSICEGEHFRYVAGVAVVEDINPPEGMEMITIPAQDYAVFTHQGDIKTLPQTMQYIYTTWLSNTPHKTLDTPDFEVYDERFIVNSDESAFDIYVPIEAVNA